MAQVPLAKHGPLSPTDDANTSRPVLSLADTPFGKLIQQCDQLGRLGIASFRCTINLPPFAHFEWQTELLNNVAPFYTINGRVDDTGGLSCIERKRSQIGRANGWTPTT